MNVEGNWGIRKGDWETDAGIAWFHGPPEYVIVHKCPLSEGSGVSCLERWDMKTMHWKCPGCLTAPSSRLVTLWKIMGGTSLLWEDELPEGTDLAELERNRIGPY